jgi:glucosamine--fructose-6-phosphate aminotransferase (isomerizing)
LIALEYRGYDSAGIAVATDGELRISRCAGKVAQLVESSGDAGHAGTFGIGHTRWATCGAPTERNAHPHRDCTGRLALVHNGIIENHVQLRDRLEGDGHVFNSDTDTETLVHLVEAHLAGGAGLAGAVRLALREVAGSAAVVVVSADFPGVIVAGRGGGGGSVVAGLGDGETFIASDVTALIPYTRKVAHIGDDEVVEARGGSVRIFDLDGNERDVEVTEVTWDHEAAQKGGYPDFMLKEIHEQPAAVRETLRARFSPAGRLQLDELRISDDEVRSIDKVFVVACGSSYHAGLVAKYAIEHWTRLPVEIDVASEFRYRDPILNSNTLVVGISQSGETADTLAAVRYAHRQKAKVVVITNVVGSSITRESDAVLYTHAGPELGVAATKTLTTQMTALWLLALWLAQTNGTVYPQESADLLGKLKALPDQMERVLADDSLIRQTAERFKDAPTFLFIGRGVGYPVALEGALKLKEISYLHAEGFAAGEMKHGPIALIEDGVTVVAVATASHVQSKLISNVEEARARGASVIAVANEGDDLGNVADVVFTVPPTAELLSPVIDVLPLQLLAYHVAKLRGRDPDRPRNLAKSVTVE